jgi:hypothetical protein
MPTKDGQLSTGQRSLHSGNLPDLRDEGNQTGLCYESLREDARDLEIRASATTGDWATIAMVKMSSLRRVVGQQNY